MTALSALLSAFVDGANDMRSSRQRACEHLIEFTDKLQIVGMAMAAMPTCRFVSPWSGSKLVQWNSFMRKRCLLRMPYQPAYCACLTLMCHLAYDTQSIAQICCSSRGRRMHHFQIHTKISLHGSNVMCVMLSV